jgi:hypothetical protein
MLARTSRSSRRLLLLEQPFVYNYTVIHRLKNNAILPNYELRIIMTSHLGNLGSCKQPGAKCVALMG